MSDLNRSSVVARTFGETERRLVICINFTVALALALCIIAVGDGDIFALFYCKF